MSQLCIMISQEELKRCKEIIDTLCYSVITLDKNNQIDQTVLVNAYDYLVNKLKLKDIK